MVKSEHKLFLMQNMPEFFTTNALGNNGTFEVACVIEDGMIQLQGGGGKTGIDAIKRMFSNAIYYLNNTNCQVYVLIFDKPNYVFKIKGIEQAKRNNNKRKATPCPNPEPGENLIPMNDILPYDWESMMSNRIARRILIQQLTLFAVESIRPPEGKILIIDGGTIEEQGLPYLIRGTVRSPEQGDKNKCAFTWEDTTISMDISRPEDLINRVGEADECHLFYLDHFIEGVENERKITGIQKPITVDILSADTDFIALNLSYSSKWVYNNFDVRIVFPNRTKEDKGINYTKDIFRIGSYCKSLHTDFGHLVKFPELCTTAVMLTTGNDYSRGYIGITPSKTMSYYRLHCEYVGDLVNKKEDDSWFLDIPAYLRLIRMLFYSKYEKTIDNFIVWATNSKQTKANNNLKNYHGKLLREKIEKERVTHDYWKVLPWSTLRWLVQLRCPKNINARIPSNESIWNRMRRLEFNLEILQMGYRLGPEYFDMKCLDFGYHLIDPEKPLTYSNLAMSDDEMGTHGMSENFIGLLAV